MHGGMSATLENPVEGNTMSNLFSRFITAIVLLNLVVGAFLLGGIFLIMLLAVVSMLSCCEVAHIISPRNKLALFLAVVFWASVFFPIVMYGLPTLIACAMLVLFIFNLAVLFLKSIDKEAFEKLCAIFFWCCYVTFAVGCVYWLMNSPALVDGKVGLLLLLVACIATWSNDTFAYFGGRIFGKRPLFLRVSSKKTWEGFFCGAVFSVVVVFLCKYLSIFFALDWWIDLSLMDLLWISIPSVALAPLGDLIESRLKRLYDTKDSSNILPGHGGILDRIDGLLLVLPWTALYAFIIRPLW